MAQESGERASEGTGEATTIRTLTAGGHSGGHHSSMTLTTMEGGNRQPFVSRTPLIYKLNSATKKGYSEAIIGDGIRLEYPKSETARGRVVKGFSNTLKSGGTAGVIDNSSSIRRLTPTECERLQGFPDNWTEGVSNTQRYKQLGNAVTTNIITSIIEKF